MSDTVTELERELRGAQEMLFFVLKAVGEPVVVTKESLHRGTGGDQVINVEDDLQKEAFVFSIVEVGDGSGN